ncbi:four helix bundle protein [Mucilaginibacter ginsenosidivorans]|uniref:Four helix bundle protein n=1 Tax=Mucilaginibacter ginsenosidivorans TaxID=398053 RepID=A0A5B8UYL8_9SPHI|nr:four helix bundle protein [Mucilaginibacter ginsenosidivorans]QEC63506.1 four helix bundle protein [Mucilaginibacter ginsenosidivorans]
MTKQELILRTKKYAIANARLVLSIPINIVNRNYADQLNRSSSSVGANYRAACRGKSKADFLNKLKIVEEELDETLYFMELLVELNPELKEKIDIIYKEGNELLSIIVAALNTLRGN